MRQLRWSANNILNGSTYLTHVVILPGGSKSYMGYDINIYYIYILVKAELNTKVWPINLQESY